MRKVLGLLQERNVLAMVKYLFLLLPLLGMANLSAQDTLTARWTFGNHEPISMYERVGKRTTGGIEGSALWLEEWHRWFDSEECPALMESLGLNWLHCRFYKGMGWDFESQDFPNVQRFVQNCHRHNIHVLAYVQYATLYYEIMLEEIPDLADWAAVDENGKKKIYGSEYYRWQPCESHPDFEKYLQKVITIALTEGDFDGIMFDNAWGAPCYCPRCRKLFREHLAATFPNPLERFGIPSVKHVELPFRRAPLGEIQDPLFQEWILWRCQRHSEIFHRLTAHAKKCKPDAVVTANTYDIRRCHQAGLYSYDIPEMTKPFDLILSQSPNAPGIRNGGIVNRVREIRLAKALGKPILALCDQDAAITDEEQYLLPLLEDVVFGGIPTDRTILCPDRENFYSKELVAFRKPLLERLNRMLTENREKFAAETFQPIRVLRSRESIFFSQSAHESLFAAEEILLRNHLPYGLLLTSEAEPLQIPEDCELLLVCDQRCLSDAELEQLALYAQRGGKLLITGKTGDYDSRYRQRRVNPFLAKVRDLPNVIFRETPDRTPPRMQAAGWESWKKSNGGKRLAEEIAQLWKPPVALDLPDTVLTEWKRQGNTYFIHLVNYAHSHVTTARGPANHPFTTYALMNETPSITTVTDGRIPEFNEYLLLQWE